MCQSILHHQSDKLYLYPSLLDAYTNLLNAEEVWMKYWGQSGNPSKRLEEFLEQEKQNFIDKLNRVPTEPSEAADRGTMLNELVDCWVEHRQPRIGEIFKVEDTDGKVYEFTAKLNGFEFSFPIELVYQYLELYKDATPQMLVSADLPTSLGIVNLYGFVDYVNPFSAHDMKTTGSYEKFKFRNHWQHIVYMYCLRQMGCAVSQFFYDICVFDKKRSYLYELFQEKYTWNDSYINDLTDICQSLWNFVKENKHLITNDSIFTEREHKH